MKKFPKAEYINVKKFSDIGSVYIKVFKDGEIIDKLKIYDGKEVDPFIEGLKKRLKEIVEDFTKMDYIAFSNKYELTKKGSIIDRYDILHTAEGMIKIATEILELFEEEKEE